MRTSIAIAIVAAAATAVSADCNPSYNVPTSTPCFTACNVKAGSSVVSGWTMDSSSPNFLKSLKLMCTKGVPEYTTFMTVAGTCMMTCQGDNPELFNAEFAGACAWYASHANDVCATETTTTAAAATTTTTTVAATTTVAPGVSSVPVVSPVSSGVPPASSGVSAASSGVSVRPSASVSPSGSGAAVPSTPAEGTANKLQISGLAIALVAGAGYLAL